MRFKLPTFRTVLHVAVVTGVIFIAAAIATFWYWSLSGEDVLDIKNDPVPVRTIREHPTAGGVVIVHVEYCKLIPATGDLRISFVGANKEEFLPLAKENSEVGCNELDWPILIPDGVPAGEYHLKFRVLDYKVNPLKDEVKEEFTSEPFVLYEHGQDS